MRFNIITDKDLEQLGVLQPDGWPDIIAEFRFYINSEFCNPIKVLIDNRIVGVGNSIVFKHTAWLAHIIVGKQFRNRGIGFQIVHRLLTDLQGKMIDTVLLIATEQGESVYRKAGFRVVSEYFFLHRVKQWNDTLISKSIIPYRDKYYTAAIAIDKKISGENREPLIKEHLDHCYLYLDNHELTGFYLPDLGEGLILAECTMTGVELMKIKYSKVDKAVLPSENIAGIDFLKHHGFSESGIKGKRMILGKEIPWKPDCLYSRIGGNFG